MIIGFDAFVHISIVFQKLVPGEMQLGISWGQPTWPGTDFPAEAMGGWPASAYLKCSGASTSFCSGYNMRAAPYIGILPDSREKIRRYRKRYENIYGNMSKCMINVRRYDVLTYFPIFPISAVWRSLFSAIRSPSYHSLFASYWPECVRHWKKDEADHRRTT